MSAQAEKWSEPKLIVDNEGELGGAANAPPTSQQRAPVQDSAEAHVAAAARTPTRKWRRLGFYLMIALLLALATGLVYLSKQPSVGRHVRPLPDQSPSVALVAQESLRARPAPTIADAQRASNHAATPRGDKAALAERPSTHPSAASAGTAPSADSTLAIPMELINGYAAIQVLEKRLDDALAQLHALTAEVQGLTGSDAQMRQQLATIDERLRRRAVTRAEQERVAQPKLAAAASPLPTEVASSVANPASQLVAVDTWNGVPSVSVSRGGEISFLSPGERTAEGMLLRSADPSTQQAVFGLPSGETIAARAHP